MQFKFHISLFSALIISGCSMNNISTSDISIDGVAPAPFDLQINHFIGFIETIPAKSDQVEIIVVPGSKIETSISNQGSSKIIEGALKNVHRTSCYNNNGIKRIKLDGKEYNGGELPHIQIAIPSSKSIGIWKSSIYGAFGDVKDAKIELVGCGKLSIGDIYGDANIVIDGSNDLVAKRTMGNLSISINGSGDVTINENLKPARLSTNGSGDILFKTQSAQIDYNVNGSGDLDIESGGGNFIANIVGSGDVDHKGFVVNPKINIIGSGDVSVHEVKGNAEISKIGSGSFNVK